MKNLSLIGNSTASPSIHLSIWCRRALVPKRLGAESFRVINTFVAVTFWGFGCNAQQNTILTPCAILLMTLQKYLTHINQGHRGNSCLKMAKQHGDHHLVFAVEAVLQRRGLKSAASTSKRHRLLWDTIFHTDNK